MCVTLAVVVAYILLMLTAVACFSTLLPRTYRVGVLCIIVKVYGMECRSECFFKEWGLAHGVPPRNAATQHLVRNAADDREEWHHERIRQRQEVILGLAGVWARARQRLCCNRHRRMGHAC